MVRKRKQLPSATDFRNHFLKFLRLMIDTGAYLDISYKGDVYRISIEDMHQQVPYKPRKNHTLKGEIESSKCKQCNGLMLNGICTVDPVHGIS